jgi:hypothetical protein
MSTDAPTPEPQRLDYVSPHAKPPQWRMVLVACTALCCALLVYWWMRWTFLLAWVFWIGDREATDFQSVVLWVVAAVPVIVGLFCSIRVLRRASIAGSAAVFIAVLALIGILGQVGFLFLMLNAGK